MDSREDRDELFAILAAIFGVAILVLAILFYHSKRDADLRVAAACERMADSMEFRRAGKPPSAGTSAPRRHTPPARHPSLEDASKKAAGLTNEEVKTALNAFMGVGRTCAAGACR